MTIRERLCLLAFGLFTWSTAMFIAEGSTSLLVLPAAAQAGVGAGLFVTALLPGRTARFS